MLTLCANIRVGRLYIGILMQQLIFRCVPQNRQDFSHRGADGRSLLDEVLRRGREERLGAGWSDWWIGVG